MKPTQRGPAQRNLHGPSPSYALSRHYYSEQRVERAGIDETFVRDLVRDQHPDLADFEIRPVPSGWDNQLWRLGDELAVRLPMTERAPALLRKEFRWLPELAKRLPLLVPTPQRADTTLSPAVGHRDVGSRRTGGRR
jgi:Phosphotransferase enzyme family